MALSNIFREPRRELIEQAFGLFVIAGIAACDVIVAAILVYLGDGTLHVSKQEFLLGMGFALPVMAAVYWVLLVMHLFGEMVCNAMAARGRDPRPKNRK